MKRSIGDVLKSRARQLGLTQVKVSKLLGVSHPTAKRWMRGESISVSQLLRLLEVLDLSFTELGALLPDSEKRNFVYTTAQEDLFIRHPSCLAYFNQLLESKTPKQIERQAKISARTTRRILSLLEKVDLIEVHPDDRIKLRVQGEPVWKPEGKLSKMLKTRAIQDFLMEKPKHVELRLIRLRKDDKSELERRLESLGEFLRAADRRSALSGQMGEPFAVLTAAGPFEWSVLTRIADLE